MKKLLFSAVLLALFSILSAHEEDLENSKDPVLFTRMPNHYITSYTENQFDNYKFWVSSEKEQPVEGHFINVAYRIKENAPAVSSLQIIRNYQAAIKKIGGQVMYEFEDGGYRYTTLKIAKNGKETWAQVNSLIDGYELNIIEKQLMQQDVLADASSMANSLRETGKVALYGILFDTGKATLKPESMAALDEIAKLMKADPGLKIYVVGHTDNAGSYDSNMKLSMDRATSVVNALVTQKSVNAASLKACGDGPTAPVATNDTEEGKALNRRVELVKQ
jgi:outer membrane protein OmpA-like peptidoglycan-associated protein